MEKILKTAQFLASKKHSKFQWGENDCHTLVLELNDLLYKENSLSAIYKKYNSIKGCFSLAKTLDAQKYMNSLGYKLCNNITHNDVVLVKHKHGYYSHVALCGMLYSMDPDRGLVTAKTSDFDSVDYTVWRRT